MSDAPVPVPRIPDSGFDLIDITTLAKTIKLAKSEGHDEDKEMPDVPRAGIEFCILNLWMSLPPLRNPFRAGQTPELSQNFEPCLVGEVFGLMEEYCLKTETDVEAHIETAPKAKQYQQDQLEDIYYVFTEGVCRHEYVSLAHTFRQALDHGAQCYPWQARDNDHTGFVWAEAFGQAALELKGVFAGAEVNRPTERSCKVKEGVREKLGRRKFELDWALERGRALAYDSISR
ncbi:hypothetical protein DE146DRAFT_761668 [Phaeosphaeria sp. MPI-PUGE-AT-0046c]|nr:hypothetical protein DE146DRAFT_761668 [Phaeosphaeria sp. MPI-PUGE-AT-0046c]